MLGGEAFWAFVVGSFPGWRERIEMLYMIAEYVIPEYDIDTYSSQVSGPIRLFYLI